MAWTHRRFTWRLHAQGLDLDTLEFQVREVLEDAINNEPKHYRDAGVWGAALGVLEFSVIVSDRDRWWVGRRVRLFGEALRLNTELPLELVSSEFVKLPAHRNRGKYVLARQRREQDA